MSILDSNTIIYLSKEIIRIDDILEENQDAIICASAILNKETLITNDIRLKKIDELTLKTIDYIK